MSGREARVRPIRRERGRERARLGSTTINVEHRERERESSAAGRRMSEAASSKRAVGGGGRGVE